MSTYLRGFLNPQILIFCDFFDTIVGFLSLLGF